jgi:hypothetical protein
MKSKETILNQWIMLKMKIDKWKILHMITKINKMPPIDLNFNREIKTIIKTIVANREKCNWKINDY